MAQRASLGEIDPKIRWPRRQPHKNNHSDWRSTRQQQGRPTPRDAYEAECQRAITAFMAEHGKREDAAR